jgi:type VI secretion system secreted protein Hcp
MAADFLLEIDGIKGESIDSKHAGCMEISSFSWGETNTGSFSMGTGGGGGKVSMQDFHFTTQLSSASPLLMEACTVGKHIAKATLFVRKQGGEQLEYYIWKFEDLIISSFQTGGSEGSPLPQEQVSFNFAKIEIAYKPQDDKGKLTSPTIFKYDQRAKKS